MHIRSKHYRIIADLAEKKQMKLEFDHSNILYHMPNEVAMNLKVE